MTRSKNSLVPIAVVLCAGAALVFGVMKYEGWHPWWSRTGEETQSGMGQEILVMRTPGGLLEVSTLRAYEQFDKKFVYTVLGREVGQTLAHIRVPATYRYHIELAPEWKVMRTDAMFKVVAPPVRPSLPVAVDLALMERDVGGSWLLVPFNERADLNALEREITAKLAQKAASSVYLQMQREYARQTVTEFVRKWLVSQERWKDMPHPKIEVVFSK